MDPRVATTIATVAHGWIDGAPAPSSGSQIGFVYLSLGRSSDVGDTYDIFGEQDVTTNLIMRNRGGHIDSTRRCRTLAPVFPSSQFTVRDCFALERLVTYRDSQTYQRTRPPSPNPRALRPPGGTLLSARQQELVLEHDFRFSVCCSRHHGEHFKIPQESIHSLGLASAC